MGKCANVRMVAFVRAVFKTLIGNVQMCECANVQMVAFVRAIFKTLIHLHIYTFSHLHIS